MFWFALSAEPVRFEGELSLCIAAVGDYQKCYKRGQLHRSKSTGVPLPARLPVTF